MLPLRQHQLLICTIFANGATSLGIAGSLVAPLDTEDATMVTAVTAPNPPTATRAVSGAGASPGGLGWRVMGIKDGYRFYFDKPIYIGISKRHIDIYRYFKTGYRYNLYGTDTIPIYIVVLTRNIDIADTIPIRYRYISISY